MSRSQQYCTFYLNDLFFGVEVEKVQEVIRYQHMTRVPRAPAALSGLINLRGQIVTAIDLRVRLALPPRPSDRLPMNVVVRDGDDVISLLVDRIGDILEVDHELFESPPATVSAPIRKMIAGAFKLTERLLLVLDVKQTLDESSQCMSAQVQQLA